MPAWQIDMDQFDSYKGTFGRKTNPFVATANDSGDRRYTSALLPKRVSYLSSISPTQSEALNSQCYRRIQFCFVQCRSYKCASCMSSEILSFASLEERGTAIREIAKHLAALLTHEISNSLFIARRVGTSTLLSRLNRIVIRNTLALTMARSVSVLARRRIKAVSRRLEARGLCGEQTTHWRSGTHGSAPAVVRMPLRRPINRANLITAEYLG